MRNYLAEKLIKFFKAPSNSIDKHLNTMPSIDYINSVFNQSAGIVFKGRVIFSSIVYAAIEPPTPNSVEIDQIDFINPFGLVFEADKTLPNSFLMSIDSKFDELINTFNLSKYEPMAIVNPYTDIENAKLYNVLTQYNKKSVDFNTNHIVFSIESLDINSFVTKTGESISSDVDVKISLIADVEILSTKYIKKPVIPAEIHTMK